MFSHNLGGGVGINGFPGAMQLYQYRAYYSVHAHNYLLETGAETGVIGLLLLLALTLIVLSRIRRVFKRDLRKNIRIIAVALWLAAMGFILHNMIDISWYNPLIGVSFWLCAGALFAVTDEKTGVVQRGEEEVVESGDKEPEQEEASPQRGGRPAVYIAVLAAGLAVAVILSGYILGCYFLAETHSVRGEELADIGEELQAIQEYDRSLDFVEPNGTVHKNLGDIYSYLYNGFQQWGEGPIPPRECSMKALAHYNRAIELEPDDAYKHQSKGLFLIATGDHAEGRRSLEEAQRLYPNNPAAFYFEGRSYEDQDMGDEAEIEYREAVALLPFFAESSIVPYREREGLTTILRSLTRLVDLMVIRGDSTGALEEIDKALVELPDSGWLYLLRGVVHLQRDELPQALADLQRAHELEPGLLDVHLYLGRTYKEMGEIDKARTEFELELEMNPDSRGAQEELESLIGGE
jgi:tetratricopeptide (TPR) repeat protein